MEPDEAALFERARILFAGPCDFIWGAADIEGLPPMGPPEIAFAGRSNVGKSSLINALTGRASLARASHTPGRTQQLNFFDLGGRLRIVDMPGYGYAKVSKEKVAEWTQLMRAYLAGRATLARVYLLIDARHGLKDVDGAMMDDLDRAAASYQIVLTKADELKPAARAARLARTQAEIGRRPAAHPQALLVSAHDGSGIGELRAAILATVEARGA